MQVKILPGIVVGAVNAPASKSAMQRACALALLHPGITKLSNPGVSNDDKAALSIIKSLGALVEESEDGISITGLPEGTGFNTAGDKTINCGESGLSIRMFTPVAALFHQPVHVVGSGSLLSRPMSFFDEVLPRLGVRVQSNNGYLPLQINGPLHPAAIEVDGSLSSQFLTGLLIAFARSTNKDVTITVSDLKSRPYIDLTLQMMAKFGYRVTNNQYESFTIHPVDQADNQPVNYTVEGDWSGAAFLLVAGAIAGKTVVKGLDLHSAQADKAVLEALKSAQANMQVAPNEIIVETAELQAFDFDATHCPDLFPPLVALAAFCKGTSTIKGISRLAHKESNRALTLQQEFAKMGVTIKLDGDTMSIYTAKGLKGAEVHSRHDHRIAMALATAALKAEGETIIAEAEAINKSYPAFFNHLELLGVSVLY